MRALRTIAVIGAVCVVSAIAEAKMPPLPANSACFDFVGFVELARDKSILVTYYPPVSTTQRIRPEERVYPHYYVMLDKAHPEERKYLLKLDGTVRMDKDRSLRVDWDRATNGEAVSEHRIETLSPGDRDYEPLIARVYGLKPGETKGIPTRASKCPSNAAGR